MIGAIYQLGLISSMMFLGIIFIGVFLVQLFYNALRWVDDKKCKPLKPFKNVDFTNDLVVIFMAGLLIIISSSVTWPVAYPGLLIFGILYTIRKFKRFQKKVDKAFNGKADKEHRHTKDEIDT